MAWTPRRKALQEDSRGWARQERELQQRGKGCAGFDVDPKETKHLYVRLYSGSA